MLPPDALQQSTINLGQHSVQLLTKKSQPAVSTAHYFHCGVSERLEVTLNF